MPVHFYRYIGKTLDSSGETVDVPGTYLDLRRSDRLTFEEGSGFDYQKSQLQLQHYDDENDTSNKPAPNSRRKTRIQKIIPPDEDKDNPQLFFEVPAIEELTLQDADQQIVRKFDNSKDNGTRRDHVRIRRVFHYDTPYDDDPKLVEGGIIKIEQGGAVRDYEKTPDTKDGDQYLDVEVIETYQFDDYRPEKRNRPPIEFLQRTTVKLDTKELMDNSEDPTDPFKSYQDEEVNPPWRLDPYQSIVNVQYAPLKQVVIGMAKDGFSTTPTRTMTAKLVKDDVTFNTDNFGEDSFSGATGLGKTVIGRGYNIVAFGKPRDDAACFIVVDGNWDDFDEGDNRIRRGVLNDRGELEFTTIGTFPSADERSAFSCSFAGGAFFIQYPADDGNEVHMAISFDGKTFTPGIKPFNGVNAPGVCNPNGVVGNPAASPIGGSVAYDKKNGRYVTTGSFTRFYTNQFVIHGDLSDIIIDSSSSDNNFMSSVSRDGKSWTPKFDTSEGRGSNKATNPTTDIANESGGASTVCFSDALKLFVASSLYKKMDQNTSNSADNNTEEYPIYVPSSAVATSPDGVNWTNKAVGKTGTRKFAYGDQFSFSYCVTFVKTGVIDKASGSDGFFLLTTIGGTDNVDHEPPTRSPNEVWKSIDGVKWVSVRQSSTGFPLAMTQINKSVDTTKVVYV